MSLPSSERFPLWGGCGPGHGSPTGSHTLSLLVCGCTQRFAPAERGGPTPVLCLITGFWKHPCLLSIYATATRPGPGPAPQCSQTSTHPPTSSHPPPSPQVEMELTSPPTLTLHPHTPLAIPAWVRTPRFPQHSGRLAHSLLASTLEGRYQRWPHCTDDKTKAQRSEQACLKSACW